MKDYFEREAVERTEEKKLKAIIKSWFSLSCLNNNVQLDGDFNATELRLLADALDRMEKECKK